ncbi:MAG: hypothetical protein RBS10_01325 [Thauera propionica]|jgi:hypothetical protein|nr:hypothetical protein [Thauera propionica]
MFQKHILALPVPAFQPILVDYLVEGRNLPLLQDGTAVVFLEPTDEHAADAWLHSDNAGVVENEPGPGVRQSLMQLELTTRRKQVADGLVLGPICFVVGDAAATLAQTADSDEHRWDARTVQEYSLAGLPQAV